MLQRVADQPTPTAGNVDRIAHALYVDVETRSPLNLKNAGADRYARDVRPKLLLWVLHAITQHRKSGSLAARLFRNRFTKLHAIRLGPSSHIMPILSWRFSEMS